MTDLDFGAYLEYTVQATWGARPQRPDDIAKLFVQQVDALAKIDPMLSFWEFFVPTPKSHQPPTELPQLQNFETIRDHYVEHVLANIAKSDDGDPIPMYGYHMLMGTRAHPRSKTYTLDVDAGVYAKSQYRKNHAQLSTSLGCPPSPEAITYDIFKSALLSFVDIWHPEYGNAGPSALFHFYRRKTGRFHETWIQYLSAPLARLITPPDTAIVDHLPNSGLLMSATTETFRVDNPAHLAVARDIEAAMAPLNELAG